MCVHVCYRVPLCVYMFAIEFLYVCTCFSRVPLCVYMFAIEFL